MIDLYYQGGPLFMGILSLVLLALLAISIYSFIKINPKKHEDEPLFLQYLQLIKQIGLFGLVFGILGQLIGLYQAFDSIQAAGMVSPALLAGGLKVSMITTLYGFIIYIISMIIWFIFKVRR